LENIILIRKEFHQLTIAQFQACAAALSFHKVIRFALASHRTWLALFQFQRGSEAGFSPPTRFHAA
jgi:hypothetical protein